MPAFERPRERLGDWTLSALLLTPWLWAGLFAALCAVTTALLGRLPAYGDPDPKQLALFTPLLSACLYALALAAISPALIALYAGGRLLFRRSLRLPRGLGFAYLAGLALIVAVFALNPLGLTNWLLD